MKFRVGDRVGFLDDKGGGTITKIVDENIVHVEIEDGFEIPVVVSNLILTSSRANYESAEQSNDLDTQVYNSDSDENVTPLYSSSDNTNLQEEGVYFFIIPENQEKPLAGNLMLYLANNTDYQILFSLFTNESGNFCGFDFGYVEPMSKIYLDTIERSKIENWVNALVQVNFFKEEKATILQPLSQTIDFKPVKTYKEDAFKLNKMIGCKAIMVQLGLVKDQIFNPYALKDKSSENLDLLKEKISMERNIESKKQKVESSILDKHRIDDKVAEVDLHINKLVDDFTNLEPKDLIDIQIDYFMKCLDQAQKERYRKIIFIHGIGDGVLKNEIHKHLKKTDGVQYYDAPYNRYGMGATEVLFYRNK